ncbi:MAG TPA: lipopolysaccharide heptosyltransferase II [Negativicutes bacterium]|nr:lipopolysaccharide heptosyltransferase II [Negativicutes bacterium]
MYNRILVINLMHIGDLLLVTPVLRTLRSNFPAAHIALLADAKIADLVKYNKNIDRLIAIDKKGYHDKLWNYIKLIREIRQEKYDLVINLHRSERASFLAGLSGAGKIVGYSTFGPHIFFDKVLENRKREKHQVEAHFDVLRETLGITTIDDRGIEMWLDDAAEAEAGRIWAEAFGAGELKVVGLNSGASWPTKRWPKEYFAALADRLLDLGYGVAYFGGTMDEELVRETRGLMKNSTHARLAVFTGRVNLLVLAALFKKCAALVTNDSGPMHVAVAMDVPLVSIFGASPVTGFSPYNEKSVVIKTTADCHPCYEHHCNTLHCMTGISVDTVLDETLKIIAQN